MLRRTGAALKIGAAVELAGGALRARGIGTLGHDRAREDGGDEGDEGQLGEHFGSGWGSQKDLERCSAGGCGLVLVELVLVMIWL